MNRYSSPRHQYKEYIFEKEPHPQSRANYIKLVRYYKQLDPTTSVHYYLKENSGFRNKFLKSVLEKNGIIKCYYCGKELIIEEDYSKHNTTENLATLDHIVPISKGGSKYDPNNINVSCKACNLKKSNLYHEEYLKLDN